MSILYPLLWNIVSEITVFYEQSFCILQNNKLIQLFYVLVLQKNSYSLKSVCILSVLVFQKRFLVFSIFLV